MSCFRLFSTLIFLTTFLPKSTAQKHDNIWIFGDENESFNVPYFGGATIDFNFNPPKITPKKRIIDMAFYCGICSDSSGQFLQFYTNGIHIMDSTDHIMQNGSPINPGQMWLDWNQDSYPNGPFAFALPSPGKQHEYHFFHVGTMTDFRTSPFYYSVIDMKQNFGKGRVAERNQVLLPLGLDLVGPVAVKHGNGRDWWIITGELSSPVIYTFLLDPTGVHGPFESALPYTFPAPEYQSVNKISPDGKIYVRCDGNHGLYIYDLDRCNGTLSNLRVLPFADEAYFARSIEFSPDSKRLYLVAPEYISVVNITESDPAATFDTLAYFDGKALPYEPFKSLFFLQSLAPDNKIYCCTGVSPVQHLINNPTLEGMAADVRQRGIDLPKYNSGTMCQFPNYRLGEYEGSPCDTLNFQLPNDGFITTQWSPNTAKQGYTLLKPLGHPRSSPITPAPRPRLSEMFIQQFNAKKELRANSSYLTPQTDRQ